MAELISNHEDYIDSDVVWNKGKLLIDGVAVDVKTVLEGLCSEYQITRKFSKDVWNNLLFAEAFAKAKNIYGVYVEGDFITITETVKGFSSYANYCVEVSTADENAGYSSLGTNEQHIASLFNSTISNNLRAWSEANLKNAKYLAVDYNNCFGVVDYSDREAIAKIAEMVKNGTKHDMERLAKAYPDGLKFEGAGFSQIIPFSVLLHFGNWDGIFPGSSNIDTPIFNEEQSEDDELITGNICREVFNFINLLNKKDLFEQEVRDAFTSLNGISGWLKSIRSQNASKNAQVLKELKTNITSEMLNPGCFRPRSRRGKSVASSINWLAIEASAISKIGAGVMKN